MGIHFNNMPKTQQYRPGNTPAAAQEQPNNGQTNNTNTHEASQQATDQSNNNIPVMTMGEYYEAMAELNKEGKDNNGSNEIVTGGTQPPAEPTEVVDEEKEIEAIVKYLTGGRDDIEILSSKSDLSEINENYGLSEYIRDSIIELLREFEDGEYTIKQFQDLFAALGNFGNIKNSDLYENLNNTDKVVIVLTYDGQTYKAVCDRDKLPQGDGHEEAPITGPLVPKAVGELPDPDMVNQIMSDCESGSITLPDALEQLHALGIEAENTDVNCSIPYNRVFVNVKFNNGFIRLVGPLSMDENKKMLPEETIKFIDKYYGNNDDVPANPVLEPNFPRPDPSAPNFPRINKNDKYNFETPDEPQKPNNFNNEFYNVRTGPVNINKTNFNPTINGDNDNPFINPTNNNGGMINNGSDIENLHDRTEEMRLSERINSIVTSFQNGGYTLDEFLMALRANGAENVQQVVIAQKYRDQSNVTYELNGTTYTVNCPQNLPNILNVSRFIEDTYDAVRNGSVSIDEGLSALENNLGPSQYLMKGNDSGREYAIFRIAGVEGILMHRGTSNPQGMIPNPYYTEPDTMPERVEDYLPRVSQNFRMPNSILNTFRRIASGNYFRSVNDVINYLSSIGIDTNSITVTHELGHKINFNYNGIQCECNAIFRLY